jgi:hypothetical protein
VGAKFSGTIEHLFVKVGGEVDKRAHRMKLLSSLSDS